MNGLSAFYARRASSFCSTVIPTLNSINESSQPAPLNRVYWIRKDGHMHRPHKVSTKILGFGVFMLGVVLFMIGLIIGLEFPVYVTDKIIRDQCILDKDHPFYDKWSLDESWTRINRLYYWELDNPEEFSRGGTPRFTERGPYVYREQRQYLNVEFSGTVMSYHTKLKQRFDADLTRKECGGTCTETDQITILNTALLQRLHEDGDWDSHVLKKMTHYIRTKLKRLEDLTEDDSALYTYLGCVDENCDNQTLDNAQRTVCDNSTINFGAYLEVNDSVPANILKKQFNDSTHLSFHILLLKIVYKLSVSSKIDFGASEVSCDNSINSNNFVSYLMVENTRYGFYNYSNESQTFLRVNLTENCGIVSVTQMFQNHLLSFRDLLSDWNFTVCSDFVCESLHSDLDTVLSYFIIISDFFNIYIFQNFIIWYKPFTVNKIHSTISQKSLALGYSETSDACADIISYRKKGIITSHSSIGEVFLRSPKTSVSTCLDQGNTDNNMIVREYSGSQFAPPGVYTETQRNHFGFTSYLPPSARCTACSRPYPNNHTYEIFNEDIYRSITYREMNEIDVDGYRLYRYEASDRTFALNQQCNLINTTSVFNYPSFTGVPKYQGSACNYLQNLISGMARDHTSYVEVEPWTGRIWRQSTKLQTSTVLQENLIGIAIQSPFDQVNFIGVPLPVYWVDKTAVISQSEIDYFGYKIVRLMSISCGGLIGLTITAVVTMGFSIFVGLLSTRKNRVEPVVEAGRASSIIHRS